MRRTESGYLRALGIVLAGDAIETDARGNAIVDDTFLLLLNAHHGSDSVSVAAAEGNAAWGVMLDTSTGGMAHQGTFVVSTYSIAPRSMAVLCRRSAVSS